MSKRRFFIVVTVYNNTKNLPLTVPHYLKEAVKIENKHNLEVSFVYVDDKSSDNSLELLKGYQKVHKDKIMVISMVKNVGQVYALTAGIEFAVSSEADVVGYITSDMQDPIELFDEMLREWESGYKTVVAARSDREERGLGILFSKLTHYLTKKLVEPNFPSGGFDFFLIDRNVAENFVRIKEKNGQPAVLILWLGYEYKVVNYVRRKREQGKSSWTFSKKMKLFIDIFTTNSYLPLRLISILGILSSFLSLCYGIYVFVMWIIRGSADAPGWTSLMLLQSFLSGILLLSLGVIGEYIWRLLEYAKGRPNYIIDEVIDDSRM